MLKRNPNNSRILIISDLHAPYNHKDALPFLFALQKKYKFTRIISIGDEIDNHSVSFHDSDPNLASPKHELEAAKKVLAKLHKEFPVMDIISSNHGDLYERKLRHHGLPENILRSRNEIYGVGSGWKFHRELVLDMPNGDEVLFHHGIESTAVNAAIHRGMSLVQGHYHTKFEIAYYRNSKTLGWGMTVGCLIDRESLAMLYAREAKKMQLIGCGCIIDSQPRLLPMKLNSKGRWTHDVP